MNDIKGIIEDCYKSDLVSDRVIKKVVEIIGQGEWQNLHDENSDICTTMGELIITLDGIADLEKENAELEATIRNTKAVDESFALQTIQLTKAKEIIEDFMITETGGIGYSELYDKAEQFLKELDNDKEKRS